MTVHTDPARGSEISRIPLRALVRNEFAVVQVTVTTSPRGSMKLVIEEPVTGNQITLDALELEALIYADRDVFRDLLTADEESEPDGRRRA